jgi:phosphoribosylformimino-5-aminoimidazole carboxamide ribotide isomerase
MDLLPAIDLLGGACVRLEEGDFERQKTYSDDPVKVACQFADEGARWVHVVDLDAARHGSSANRGVIGEVVAALAAKSVRVQVGGGVRSLGDLEELLGRGVSRVVLGTVAVEDPILLERACGLFPGAVVVGLDHREGWVRVRGWTQGAALRVEEVMRRAAEAGAAAAVVTDIARDGTLGGPALVGLGGLLDLGVPVIASGGVSSLEDLRDLGRLRSPAGASLAGVVVGRAIYEGRLGVAEALACVGERP